MQNSKTVNTMLHMNWRQLLNPSRPRPSSMGPDHREQFERDYDRAIFSTPVKRLQDKAQVFPLEPHDAVRTRLTHSLEVSAVARGLAISVGKWLLEEKQIEPGMERQIEAISGTCGLIHDLGNPPFGHAGEDAIRAWFKKRGEARLRDELKGDEQRVQDLLQFDGNAQTLRLVSKLQILADFNGLNLTFGTLSAACKYVAASHEANKDHHDHARTKPGFFSSENGLIKQIREQTGTGDARNPITFLVESADDIVYSVADIEDGIKKAVISWKEVEDILREDGVTDTNGTAVKVLALKEAILKAGRDSAPKDLSNDVHGSAFRTASIAVLVSDAVATFKRRYGEIMEGMYHGELVGDGDCRAYVKTLKKIGRSRIYCTQSTLKLELMGRSIIHDLMDLCWEGAETLSTDGKVQTKDFAGRAGALLSPNYREVFCHFARADAGENDRFHRYLLVTDQVCGMTDTFAKRFHSELNNG